MPPPRRRSATGRRTRRPKEQSTARSRAGLSHLDPVPFATPNLFDFAGQLPPARAPRSDVGKTSEQANCSCAAGSRDARNVRQADIFIWLSPRCGRSLAYQQAPRGISGTCERIHPLRGRAHEIPERHGDAEPVDRRNAVLPAERLRRLEVPTGARLTRVSASVSYLSQRRSQPHASVPPLTAGRNPTRHGCARCRARG